MCYDPDTILSAFQMSQHLGHLEITKVPFFSPAESILRYSDCEAFPIYKVLIMQPILRFFIWFCFRQGLTL